VPGQIAQLYHATIKTRARNRTRAIPEVAKVKAIRASLRIHHQVVSKLQYVSVMEHAGQS